MTVSFSFININLKRLRCFSKPFSSLMLAILVVYVHRSTSNELPSITSVNITDVCAKACVPTTLEPYADKKDKLNTTLWRHPKAGTAGVCFRCEETETDCKRAQLSTVCPQFVNSNTTRLNLQGNLIGPTLNGALVNATSLQVLDLRSNRLERVTRDDFRGLKQLEWLDLSENTIRANFTWEENMFADMYNLDELRLNNLHLTFIPKTFFANESSPNNVLTKLDLSNNELTEIPFDALERLPYLLELDLSGNKISQLTRTALNGSRRALHLEHLKVLRLSGNNLKNIDAGTFVGLPALKQLVLNNNRELMVIDRDAFGKVSHTASPSMKLETLDLYQCSLKRLNNTLVEWEELLFLRLDGNPWSCDCTMAWALNSWFLPKNSKLKNADSIVCAYPAVNANHQMNTLSADQMPCTKLEEHELHRYEPNDFDDESGSSYSPVAKFFIILFMLCVSAAILGGIFVLYRRARGAAAGRNVPYRAVFNQGSTSRDEHAAVFDEEDGLPSRSPYEI